MGGLTLGRMVVAGIVLVLAVACASNDGQDVAQPDGALVPANALIHLVDPLDDPGHYCIDVVGFGSGVLLQEPLQAHTCKPADNRDEQFTYRPSTGQLYMEEYQLCLQPENLAPGSELYLRGCSDSPLQRFELFGDGFIRLPVDGRDQLCVAVAPGEGEIINSIHKRRDLSLAACDATEPSLIQWTFSEAAPAQGSQGIRRPAGRPALRARRRMG